MFVLKPNMFVAEQMHGDAAVHLAAHGDRTAYPADLLHVSLLCLGDSDEPSDAVIRRAMTAAESLRARPLPVTLVDSAMFGGKRHLALHGGKGNLLVVQFARMLGGALKRHNLPRSKTESPTPHVTVAYDCRKIEPMPVARNYAWIAGEFMLVYSHFGEARHEEFGRWPFDPKAAPYPEAVEQLRLAL